MNQIKINKKFAPLFDINNKCRYFIITGGRGSSKSFSVSTNLSNELCLEEHRRILFTRYTMKAAHISIIPEFLEKIEILGLNNSFKDTKDEIKNIFTGNDIWFRGIKTSEGIQTANLKSIQGVTDWVLDEAEELINEKIFIDIDLSIRLKNIHNRIIIILNPCFKTHWIFKRFFNDVKFDFNGIKNEVCYIHTSYLDNITNLSESFIAQADKMKINDPIKYRHIFLGEWVDETVGALWKMSTMIAPYRIKEAPKELKRIVVAIDPSVSSTGSQDECGIIVAAEDFNKHYYILKDVSGIYSPSQWAKIAIGEYKNFDADKIVAEVNQGGDLVKMNLHNIDKSVPVKMVRATRGKLVRAEPIAGLYEEGQAHHVGNLSDLEIELTTYTGEGNSPGRLDALVWALTELSQKQFAEPSIIVLK